MKIQSIPGEWWESCQDSADQMAPQWVFHKKYEFYEEQKETSVAFSHYTYNICLFIGICKN